MSRWKQPSRAMLSAILLAAIVRSVLAQEDGLTTRSASYFSEAENRRQSFQVVLPPGYNSGENPNTKFPLFVQVFGGSNLLPTRERPFIRVRPSGRGVWGYRSMSRYDVLQVVQRAKALYRVDSDRVYITGTSAGATGVMHTAAQRPDVFAGIVPLVAFGNDLPLANFRNLPIRCEHGVNDWTSAICNVRVQFQKLARLEGDAVLNEHATAGHGVRVPPRATMDWLFQQKRNRSPKHITYSCEHPRDGRAYWLRIEEFKDPHQVARIEGRANADGIRVTTSNIQRLSFDVATMPLSEQQAITVDGDVVRMSPRRGQRRVAVVFDESWKTLPKEPRRPSQLPYGAGAAANLFQGEPLLIIYGTGGADDETRFLQQLANVLARTGGPAFRAASVHFPVLADNKLETDESLEDVPLSKRNLMLVGTAENNAVLKRIAREFPYRIEDGLLHAGDREPLPLAGSVLGFHYFNPESPQRTIYVVSPCLVPEQRAACLKNPRVFLAGSEGFKMTDQPDLFVRGINLRIRREMQLSRDWKFIAYEGTDQRVPAQFTDRVHLAAAHLRVMLRKSKADLALWWGPEDKGLFGGYDFNWLPTFDPKSYTLADYAVRHRETETMTGVVPGRELLDIHKRWIGTRELIALPALAKDDIEADREYRIVIPMDMVPKLGIRRKVLGNVAPGPDVMPAEVAAEIPNDGP